MLRTAVILNYLSLTLPASIYFFFFRMVIRLILQFLAILGVVSFHAGILLWVSNIFSVDCLIDTPRFGHRFPGCRFTSQRSETSGIFGCAIDWGCGLLAIKQITAKNEWNADSLFGLWWVVEVTLVLSWRVLASYWAHYSSSQPPSKSRMLRSVAWKFEHGSCVLSSSSSHASLGWCLRRIGTHFMNFDEVI